MTRDRIRMLTWMLAILAPATFAIAAGLNASSLKEEPQGQWECVPVDDSRPLPSRVQA